MGEEEAKSFLQTQAEELCRIFLGWKLREDFDALLALGEGELSIDLLNGESSCDGDPLPPLFIAGELQSHLQRELERDGSSVAQIQEARLQALFARTQKRPGRSQPTLKITCRAQIRTGTESFEAEAHNT